MKLVQHSYKDSCVFLLKDLSDTVEEITVEEKEALIAKGVSYSEMISKEEAPSSELKALFVQLLQQKKETLAAQVAHLAQCIYEEKGESLVLVSLARAGTPFGILVKRYLDQVYGVDIPHYSVSIIRGKGIDEQAMHYILNQHPRAKVQFIDGWTGKGSIIDELRTSIRRYNETYQTALDERLAVLADPAKRCEFYGTREDINIPNCCLNSTVSGLISRTIHNSQVIAAGEFHGAKMLARLASDDVSQYFVDEVSSAFGKVLVSSQLPIELVDEQYANQVVEQVKKDYSVRDRHKIKLSIGEATRVLLRRKARVLLLKDVTNPDVAHLLQLANEKKVPIERYDGADYEAIAIIEEVGDVYE